MRPPCGFDMCMFHARQEGQTCADVLAGGAVRSASLEAVFSDALYPHQGYRARVENLVHDDRFRKTSGVGQHKDRVCINPDICVQPVGFKPHPDDPEEAWLMWITSQGNWAPYHRRNFMNLRFDNYFRNPPPVCLHRQRPSLAHTHSNRTPCLDTRCAVRDIPHDTAP